MSTLAHEELSADLRFPLGRYRPPSEITEVLRDEWIRDLEALSENLRKTVNGLSEEQLDARYRPGGWTVRQVVHHLPDSHINSYVRFRLALTEDEPTIKPYDEARWAGLVDARTAPVEVSLALLESLHERWVLLLRSLTPSDWRR